MSIEEGERNAPNRSVLELGLSRYAEGFIFPEENLIEVAQIAEDYSQYKELSNTLLDTCAKMLLAVFEAPNDPQAFAAKWSKPGTSTEDSVTALRLLGRVDGLNLAFIKYPWCTARVISHLRNIKLAIKPRARLQAINNLLGQSDTIHETLDTIYKHSTVCDFLKSLRLCQRLDKVRSQKKKTILFGNFSQTSGPPPPPPPFGNPLSKKIFSVYFAF